MAETISTRVGHAFAKLLRIDLGPTPSPVRDETRTYGYYEHEPTVGDWCRGHTPTAPQVRRYIWSLFPFLHWIGYHNVQWLIGDLVAGENPRRNSDIQRLTPVEARQGLHVWILLLTIAS